MALAPHRLFRPSQLAAFLPVLATFAEVDRALEAPRMLIPEEESWRYFRGRTEPSPDLEWASLEHDDARWEMGKSVLTGWTQPLRTDGTILADQVGSYTTLYLRRAFDVADPKAVLRLVLAVQIEDGFVAFLNGKEVGRVNAGKPGEKLPCNAVAKRTYRARATEAVEIDPSLLVPVKNVLAIQVLSYAMDSRLHVLPVLAAVMTPDRERDERRTGNLFTGPDGSPDASLVEYRQGRILQREGRRVEALQHFERAGQLDRGSFEPLLRRLACHSSLGELPRVETLVREAIEEGEIIEGSRLWRAWFHALLVDLKRSPAEALAAWPRDPRPGSVSAASPSSDHRWLLEQLAEHRVLRLNCGGEDHETKDGKRWSRDRFFLGGASSDKKSGPKESEAYAPGDDKAVHGVERVFSGARGTYHLGYDIPLPPGRWRVSLHFVESAHRLPGRRIFDIFLEGKAVLEGYDPVLAGFTMLDIRPFEIEVADGTLQIDFLAHQDVPRISALEVEAIGE